MDTNYLLAREQVSRMRALSAASPQARAAHAGLARGYGALLAKAGFPYRGFDFVVGKPAEPSENPDMLAAA